MATIVEASNPKPDLTVSCPDCKWRGQFKDTNCGQCEVALCPECRAPVETRPIRVADIAKRWRRKTIVAGIKTKYHIEHRTKP